MSYRLKLTNQLTILFISLTCQASFAYMTTMFVVKEEKEEQWLTSHKGWEVWGWEVRGWEVGAVHTIVYTYLSRYKGITITHPHTHTHTHHSSTHRILGYLHDPTNHVLTDTLRRRDNLCPNIYQHIWGDNRQDIVRANQIYSNIDNETCDSPMDEWRRWNNSHDTLPTNEAQAGS